jgi:putative ABC transport system ATP-binding protein
MLPGSAPALSGSLHRYRPGNTSLIELRQVIKTYHHESRSYSALRGIDLQVNSGEFVGVIGKSGSGKSTLINMITGIDRPTSGAVLVGDAAVHALNENQMAVWRGRTIGIVFQFFQLLPTLSLMQNVMLPMDFCRMYSPKERQDRALFLLDQVGMAAHADTLPSAVSGGQQQRTAIARALANDPPIVVADEPTGNLDSETSETIFALFKRLSGEGKTVVMVTHDNDLAARVDSTIIVADGQVINRYVSSALHTLSLDQLAAISARFTPRAYLPGSVLIQQGDTGDQFFILTRGEVEVILRVPGGQEILVDRLQPGQMFGEMALLAGGPRTATVRASTHTQEQVEVMTLSSQDFRQMVAASTPTREEFHRILRERSEQRPESS